MKAQLFDLSDMVVDKWHDLAGHLSMSRCDLEMIEPEVHTKKERARKMLYTQRLMLGDNATIEKVNAELKQIDHEQKKKKVIASKRL